MQPTEMSVFFFALLALFEACHAQIVYMPRYMVRPVRRSAMDALERLRLPVARYFPRVDNEVAAYQGPPSFFSGYPVGEAYNVPQDYVQPAEEEDYEYDMNPMFRPAQYGEEVYAQQEPIEDPNAYNDIMDRYLMAEPKEEMFDIQRRSPPNATDATTSTPQVQMTAVPAAPEKKDVKSLVVPDTVAQRDDEEGQKEEPLFRPSQSSQRTLWKDIRGKNTQQQKTPIPLLKKMIIQSGQKRNDPLLDELNSLKKKH